MVLSKKGFPTHQREKKKEAASSGEELPMLLLPNENHGMSPYPQFLLLEQYRLSMRRLTEIFVMLPTELRVCSGCSPTSSGRVERALAKYISQSLGYSRQRNDHTAYIQSLLRDYKVVQFLPCQKHSVSLQRVHAILQDNFPDSSLRKLFDLLIIGNATVETKVITFF